VLWADVDRRRATCPCVTDLRESQGAFSLADSDQPWCYLQAGCEYGWTGVVLREAQLDDLSDLPAVDKRVWRVWVARKD